MRLTDRALLHPTFRERLKDLEAKLVAEHIPLYIYEGARTPWRQAELYARGRHIPNTKRVTNARAWSSYHQYGLAADYVFRVNGGWSWDEPKRGMWKRYIDIAHSVGLDHATDLGLSETPHVQLPWPSKDARQGIFPINGDATWMAWLSDQIERWGSFERMVAGASHPGGPPPFDIEMRPEVDEVA